MQLTNVIGCYVLALVSIARLVVAGETAVAYDERRRQLSAPEFYPSLEFGSSLQLSIESGQYSKTLFIPENLIHDVIERGQSVKIQLIGGGDIAISQTTQQPAYDPADDHERWYQTSHCLLFWTSHYFC